MQLSPNPDDRRVNSKILGISAKVGENIAGGKLMSRSVRAADNKMAVMLDRNPLNSESFLQGLRQKQHRWGAAWGIQNRFNQRFCIETVLTQKSSRDYCLEDVAILTEGKSSCRLQPSCQLDFQQLEMAYLVAPHMFKVHSHRIYVALATFTKSRRVNSQILGISAKVGGNTAGGKLMSRSVRAADNKMAVMLDRNPLNSESFCRA